MYYGGWLGGWWLNCYEACCLLCWQGNVSTSAVFLATARWPKQCAAHAQHADIRSALQSEWRKVSVFLKGHIPLFCYQAIHLLLCWCQSVCLSVCNMSFCQPSQAEWFDMVHCDLFKIQRTWWLFSANTDCHFTKMIYYTLTDFRFKFQSCPCLLDWVYSYSMLYIDRIFFSNTEGVGWCDVCVGGSARSARWWILPPMWCPVWCGQTPGTQVIHMLICCCAGFIAVNRVRYWLVTAYWCKLCMLYSIV